MAGKTTAELLELPGAQELETLTQGHSDNIQSEISPKLDEQERMCSQSFLSFPES